MKKTFFYGYIIVFVIFVLQIVMFGPRTSFGVFIKPITDEFDWPRALVAGAFSVSTLVQAFSSIIMGWLNDRKGPRFVLTICGILVGTGLLLMSTVGSAWQLYFFYVVPLGLGMGSLVAPQMSTIARWFVKRRNLMTAVMMAGGGLGGLIGPPLITWLIYTRNWRDAFLFVGIGVFILIILAAQFLKRDPSQLGQVPYGEKSETQDKAAYGISGVSLKQAFQTGKYWLFAITIFCIGFCFWTIMVHIVPYSIDQGISPAVAAMILSAMNGAQPVGSIIVGFIADRIGSKRGWIFSVSLLSAILLFLLPVTNPWLFAFFVMIMAFGIGGISVIQSSMTAELFGMKAHGTILGSTVFTFSFGGAAGTYIAGTIFDATGSYQWVFCICGILAVAAIIMAIFMNKIKNQQ
jgi:MFS family permease